MFSGTAERRKAIMDGSLLPKFEMVQQDLDGAEMGREAALGALKRAKAANGAVISDMRHVARCRDFTCERCESLTPTEAE